MFSDYIKLSLLNIKHRKLRSWLTLIGIFIGVMAVVALISISVGMQDAIKSEFEEIGATRIIIAPGGYFFGPGSTGLTSATFDASDFNAVKKVRGVEIAVPILSRNAKIEFKGQTVTDFIIGGPTDPETLKVTSKLGVFKAKKGRSIETGDTYAVVVSYNLAYNTFKKDIKVGSTVNINGHDFKVIGILPEGLPMHTGTNRIPLSIAREIFDEPKEISNIFVFVKEGFQPKDVAEDIKKKLRNERDVKEGEEDFYVETAQQVIDTFSQVLAVVQAVLIGIAAISLLVGALGIMNTMFTSVTERTKEIGIMKSIGASNNSIALLFMVESGVLGLLGGLLSILAGYVISKAVEILAIKLADITLVPGFSLTLVLSALAFSFMIGMLSGLLPAIKAAKLQPVEALRK